jgi:hypothetical protein
MNIWQLQIEIDDYLYVQPNNLQDCAEVFQCKPLHKKWKIPAHSIFNEDSALADFVGFCIGAPIVNNRTKEILLSVPDANIEFLPFAKLAGSAHWVLNALHCTDGLDLQKSNLSPGGERYIFKPEFESRCPLIFKDINAPSEIFVNRMFGELLTANKVKGVALADPRVSVFHTIVQGQPANVFPSLEP